MRQARLLLLAVVPLVLAVCAVPATADAATVWLCKPGLANDPCKPSLKTTRFSPTGQKLGVSNVKRARRPKFDCFYVYPTVSNAPPPLAPLQVSPELRSIALYQAARYSRDCRVYTPVYRQVPLAGLFSGAYTRANLNIGYGDVRDAWRTYLRRHNKGRGVVLISHSQGTLTLRRLVREEIDLKSKVRRRLISALLLGGNIEVAKGKDRGGDFKRIRACRSSKQVGCVVAFSTFQGPVPADTLWGRADAGKEVLCTNPTSLRGGSGIATPVFPSEPFAPGGIATGIAILGVTQPKAATAWVSLPRSYRARCSRETYGHVLQIQSLRGAPTFRPSPTPGWGLHLVDANIALENLTDLVRRQAAVWSKRNKRR